MRKTCFIIMASLVTIYVSSCNPINSEKAPKETAPPTLDKQWAKTFIDSMNNKFSEQIAAGDSVALASHYWPDAELMLDHSESVKGKDIVQTWGEAIRVGIKELALTTTDITGTPDFVIETGKYEMKDAKKNLVDKGKYVVVWEKRHGEWKLYRDIGSTSMPAGK